MSRNELLTLGRDGARLVVMQKKIASLAPRDRSLSIGKCQDCGALYMWRSGWALRTLFAEVWCDQCGSELYLVRTTWGKRKQALRLLDK
jgi:hypothetical protein